MSQQAETPKDDKDNLSETVNAEQAAAYAASAQHTDTLPGIEEQLRQAELLATEHHDAWLRAKAETENVRRRAQDDVAKAAKFAIEKFASELLMVKDSLEQALAVEAPSVESIREGADLTLKNLAKAFEKSGIEEINPVGEKFDPHKHQAISAVPSEQPANTVVQVFQKGYLLEGRVMRPALVAVSQSA